jgi:hypothetical protein
MYCLSCILQTASTREASKLSHTVASEKHVDGSIMPFLKKFSCTYSGKPRNPSANAPTQKIRKQNLIITYTIHYQKNNFRIFNNAFNYARVFCLTTLLLAKVIVFVIGERNESGSLLHDPFTVLPFSLSVSLNCKR